MKKIIDEVESVFTLKNIVKFVMMFIASGVVFVGLVYVLFTGTEKSQKVQCIKYQAYAKEFEGFWISAEDKVECDAVGISVDVPVH